MRFFVAVNAYRSSTSEGFGNTWGVKECDSRKHQNEVLSRGLVVRDCQSIFSDGTRGPTYSTMGVRLATPAEIREAKRDEERNCQPIEQVEPWRGAEFELVDTAD